MSNWLSEFDRRNTVDGVTRLKVEALIFEMSYKFFVNRNLSARGPAFELIQQLNADPSYGQYVLLVKVYLSLCQINKSAEVDYYKLFCDGAFRIVIPRDHPPRTFLIRASRPPEHLFSHQARLLAVHVRVPRGGDAAVHLLRARRRDQLRRDRALRRGARRWPAADRPAPGALRPARGRRAVDGQVLLRRPDPSSHGRGVLVGTSWRPREHPMAWSPEHLPLCGRYVEFANVFRAFDGSYLIFIADNALLVDVQSGSGEGCARLNNIVVEAATIYFNEAVSFVPCFKNVSRSNIRVASVGHVAGGCRYS